MENYEQLTKAGMDVDGFLKRLMGNASLVKLFIRKFIEDQNMAKLEAAFLAGDMKAAEMASHTLKGMCGNLSLTELYGLFTEQVNLIRSGEDDKAREMMDRIRSTYASAISGMEAWLTETGA